MSESTWRTSSCWFVVVAALAPLPAQSQPQPPLRAAVLEHADRWTGGATGLAWLLQQGGFVVEALSAEELARADLVAFGSFTNNGAAFPAFVRDHGVALLDFVARGGVVLIGGEIHVSRHPRHSESAARVGYVLDQLVVSPPRGAARLPAAGGRLPRRRAGARGALAAGHRPRRRPRAAAGGVARGRIGAAPVSVSPGPARRRAGTALQNGLPSGPV